MAVQADESLHQLKKTLTDALQTDHILAGISGCQRPSYLDLESRVVSELEQLFAKSSQDQTEALLQQGYLPHVACCHNHMQVTFFLEILRKLVTRRVLTSRLVCSVLISNLKFDQEFLWCQSLHVLRMIISSVDYRGCRDLFVAFLNQLGSLPALLQPDTHFRVDKTVEFLSYVLNRQTCPLPAYVAQTEIVLRYTKPPHWCVERVLSDFAASFKPLAHAVSLPGRQYLLPIVSGNVNRFNTVLRVDVDTLKFPVKGALPFDEEVNLSQKDMLLYALAQPYSRDIICFMLSLDKQRKNRCQALEMLMVDALVLALSKCDEQQRLSDASSAKSTMNLLGWHHLSSQLIYFVLFGFASFKEIMSALRLKLARSRPFKAGRDPLMWVLLQFISGTLAKSEVLDLLPIMDIFHLLYPEKDALPVPDFRDPQCSIKFTMACVWVQLSKKMRDENPKLFCGMPDCLKNQVVALEQLHAQITTQKQLSLDELSTAVFLNAYSNTTAVFQPVVVQVLDLLYGSPAAGPANLPVVPCPVQFLDSLTVHVKMSLLHQLSSKIITHVQQFQRGPPPSPALLETYSRLMVYMEIETLGIKNFMTHILPHVLRNKSLSVLNVLVEMFAFRLQQHHIQPHYRVQLLLSLHQVASQSVSLSYQLYLNAEMAALRLISSFDGVDVQTQLARLGGEVKMLVTHDSEELNRALILALVRALRISGCDTNSGAWVDVVMNTFKTQLNYSWPSHLVKCFPASLQEYFVTGNDFTADRKDSFLKQVDDEWASWQSQTTEQAVSHFAQNSQTPAVFLCIIWRCIMENKPLTTTCLRVLERFTAKQLSAHIRMFSDYLVFEFKKLSASNQVAVQKGVNAVRDMVWTYDILTLDKLVLTMIMRHYDAMHARVCFFIIQLLLFKEPEYRCRVNSLTKEVSPQHWLVSDSYTKHKNYLQTYPDSFHFDGLASKLDGGNRPEPQLPIYFGNTLLRFLPVLDLVIHRMLELVSIGLDKSLHNLLDHSGGLYKFHDRPVTFVYSTFHYYEGILTERPLVKKKMVQNIIAVQHDLRPQGWCLSPAFLDYLASTESHSWTPDADYFNMLVEKLVNTLARRPNGFPSCDWRFLEFSNATDLGVHATCLELLALPSDGPTVVNGLLDAITDKVLGMVDTARAMEWINAVGNILLLLPEAYWSALVHRLIFVLKRIGEEGVLGDGGIVSDLVLPTKLIGWKCQTSKTALQARITLSIAHAFWYHSTLGQMSLLPVILKEQLKPLVQTEHQFLYVLQLVGPILHRLNEERIRCLLKLVNELYAMLKVVDASCDELHHMDVISDYLYHLKYMFLGEVNKGKAEEVYGSLRPSLKSRLRFMVGNP